MIAALYVETNGCYYGLDYVDPWDVNRDARKYDGPYPVIAHPPCERWGRYWGGGPMLAKTPKQKILGDDNGCFAAALASVRKFGGVLEHPEASHAFKAHGLPKPPRNGGWISVNDGFGGLVCCVEQGHYGHKARKATWLYTARLTLMPPELAWGKSPAGYKPDDGYHSKEERRKAVRCGTVARLSRRERMATPESFRDLLIRIASSVRY